MAGRFYMRFNLQNSDCVISPSIELFARLLPHTREELLPELEDFERIQGARVERLRADYPQEIDRLRGRRVLFIGDSITSDNLGYRTSVGRAAELDSVEGAISGSTTETIRSYALDLVRASKAEIVSLMLGANDAVQERRGEEVVHLAEPAQYEQNLRTLFEAVRESGARLLILEITRVNEADFARSFASVSRSQTNATVDRYNAILRRVAAEFGVTPVKHSYFEETAGEFLERDGIHLSPLGQEHLSALWLQAAAALC